MYLEKILIKKFRNYDNLELDLNDGVNIIYGSNAQGKTNLLEAIYVLALTKSYRSFIDNNLIKNNETISIIQGTIRKNEIKTDLKLVLEEKNKQMFVDNNDIKKLSDYISYLNVIIFYPEDLEIIKGLPSERRKYINLELCQLYPNYFKVLLDFNKLLRIRNECLKKISRKEEVDMSYFDIITEYYIDKATFIYRARKKFIDKINENCGSIYKKLANSNSFRISYDAGINSFDNDLLRKELKSELTKNLKKEIKLGMTFVGPHRDDISFYLNNLNIRKFGSQGQQRLAMLSLKLSEIEIFKNYKGYYPIVLLDDVFSELDITKRKKIVKFIKKDIQSVITTTEIDLPLQEVLKEAKTIKIKDGKIIRIKECKNGKNRTL